MSFYEVKESWFIYLPTNVALNIKANCIAFCSIKLPLFDSGFENIFIDCLRVRVAATTDREVCFD